MKKGQKKKLLAVRSDIRGARTLLNSLMWSTSNDRLYDEFSYMKETLKEWLEKFEHVFEEAKEEKKK